MMGTKHKFFFYHDEIRDDFADNGIRTKPLPEDYEYLPRSLWWRLLEPPVHFLINLFFIIVNVFMDGYHIRNARSIKMRDDLRKGYFVFGNHTTWVGDAMVQPVLVFPRRVYTVVHPDAVSIPFASIAIRMGGAIPRPESMSHYRRFLDAIDRMYERGNAIVIYPEAHIWPKYNRIRPFPDVSFGLPARLGAPCFVKTTVWEKGFRGHTHPVFVFDGPIYPDMSLPMKEAQKKLRDEVYAVMCERTRESCLDDRYHYIKVGSPKEVRTYERKY